MIHKFELLGARLMLVAVALVAAAPLLGGCTQMEGQFGGKVLGASVTLAGVTVALSGTIPTAPAAAPTTPEPAKAAP